MFFEQEVNLNDRNEMIGFLKDHYRYYTMSSWNRSTSYANDVKITNLGLSSDLLDKAYDLLYGDANIDLMWMDIDDIMFDFKMRTNYSMAFNGRSGGYLVLYQQGYDKQGNRCVYPGMSIDKGEDFEEFSDEELQERINLVCDFDRTCDEIRDMFIKWIENSEEKTEKVVVTKKYIRLKDNM